MRIRMSIVKNRISSQTGHTKHTRRNVYTSPYVTLFIQNLARKTRTTSYVKQKSWLVWWKVQELESTVGHRSLDRLDTGATRVWVVNTTFTRHDL